MPISLNETQLFTNNAVTLLATPIGPSDTSLTVMTGYGALFPSPAPGEFFLVTLENQSASLREIIKVNGRTGDTFTNIERGIEGTTPQSWGASLGNDTLVDHRITAETMTRAMQLPHTLNELSDVDTMSASPGDALMWNGSVWVPQSVSAGSAWIYGANTGPTLVPASTQSVVSATMYTSTNRTFKFMVTVHNPVSFNTRAFEFLVTIIGDVGSNAETVVAVQYATVGTIAGSPHAVLNTGTKVLSLEWENNEASSVTVLSTRVQHQM